MIHPYLSHSVIKTPIGEMLILCSDLGVRGCWFMGQKHFPKEAEQTPAVHTPLGSKHHQQVQNELTLYFNHKIDQFNIPLDLDPLGTPFQKEVWQALLSIPLGETLSYSEIATLINRPNSTRAVGSAIGKNPISIIIPCHRVISKSGSLTGYAGGIDRKQYLLNLESQKARSGHLGRSNQ